MHRQSRVLTVLLLAAMLGLVSARQGRAQQEPIASFEGLGGLLQLGDELYITDTTGLVHHGTVSGIAPGSLILVTPGAARQFEASDVSTIERLRRDSKKSGALIGFAVGAGAGAGIGAFASAESGSYSGASPVLAGLAFGAVGALVGAGIDSLNPGKRVLVYRMRPGESGSLEVQPMLLPTRRAILVRVAF